MCGRFQKTMHNTLHTTACLDQHLITINSPTVVQCSTITDCLCSPVATPPPPAVCLSLSVYAWTRPSTARTGRAWEKRPPDVLCWARSSGPQTHAGLWPTSWGTLPMSWLGIKLLHHRRLSPTLLSPRVVFSGPPRSRLAALLPTFSSHVCIRGRSYVQGNNRRGCD